MLRKSVVVVVSILVFSMSCAAIASAKRFTGYVAGAATGKGHSFVVGDGLNLVFIDRGKAGTKYKVCWRKQAGGSGNCWRGRTGARRARNSIFTAAPAQTGNFVVQWFIHGHRKAHWSFHNGVGD